MNKLFWKRCGVPLGLAVIFAGCAQPPPAANTFTLRDVSSTRSSDGAVRVKLTTTGDLAEADASLVVAYVRIVAVREATRHQRQIAQQRARTAYQKIASRPRGFARKTRYLAVKTEKSAPGQGPKVEASVMIFDTQTQELVGNNVYEVQTAPARGSVAHFDTYTAEYVGGL